MLWVGMTRNRLAESYGFFFVSYIRFHWRTLQEIQFNGTCVCDHQTIDLYGCVERSSWIEGSLSHTSGPCKSMSCSIELYSACVNGDWRSVDQQIDFKHFITVQWVLDKINFTFRNEEMHAEHRTYIHEHFGPKQWFNQREILHAFSFHVSFLRAWWPHHGHPHSIFSFLSFLLFPHISLSQSKLNCEVLYDDLAFEVRWAVAGESIVIQLVAKLGIFDSNESTRKNYTFYAFP